MESLILFVLMIASFVFYGVVGADKIWLLGPAMTLAYLLITMVAFKGALAKGSGGNRGLSSVLRRQSSTLLWISFVIYGVLMVSNASVSFESKLVVLFVGAVIGAYFVWGEELTSFKDNRLLLGFLIFVVMVLALYGLITHFKAPERILWAERYTDHYDGRLASTYICPNHFAHLMQMLMPFGVALLFIRESGMFLRMFCGYSLASFLPPLFLTESRAGWLGAIAGVGVTVCLMALRRSKKLFLLIVVLVPLFSALLLFSAWRFSDTFQRRMTPVVTFLQGQSEEGIGAESKDFRPQTWMDTIDMIKEAPLIGFGPGNYRYTFPEHRKRCRAARMVTGHPHNEYLELIADYGLIGFGLFALAWCYGLIRILIASVKAEETRHAFIGFAFLGTAAGTMVHSFFDFEMHVFPNALVFAFLAAITVGPLFYVRKKSRRTRPKRLTEEQGDRPPESSKKGLSASLSPLWLKKSAAWLLAVGYLLMTLVCLQTMSSAFLRAIADRRADEQGTQLALGDERCVGLYVAASRIDSSNWRAYKGMANLIFNQRYFSLDMSEKAALAAEECEWYAKAYQHNQKDPEICMAYGKCLIFLGRTEGRARSANVPLPDNRTADASPAIQSPDTEHSASGDKIFHGLNLLREACIYRPFNDMCWWNLGVELRKLGRYDEALRSFEKAQSIRRTQSTKANISWVKAQIKAGNATGQVAPDSAREMPIDCSDVPSAEEWSIPDPTDADTDPELLNLFDRMEN